MAKAEAKFSRAGDNPSTDPPIGLDGKCVLCDAYHNAGYSWMFSCCFGNHNVALIESLNVAGGFYSYLEKQCVFGKGLNAKWIIAEIKGESNPYDQKTKLLERLQTCDDDKFNAFLRVLEATGNRQAAAAMKNHFYAAIDFKIDLWSSDVKTCSREFYLTNYEKAYPMTSNPRGTALIINIVEAIPPLEKRIGSEIDVTWLTKLFETLHFRVVPRSNITSKDIPGLITDTLSKTTRQDQCFILFTMSHGGLNSSQEEVIIGADGAVVTKKSILEIVCNGDSFPLPKETPRLVFFEACRGGLEIKRTKVIKNGFEELPANVLCAHSSTKEHVSYSHETLGARFVRAFHETVAQNARDTDIVTLMEQVKKATRAKDPDYLYVQTPEFNYNFTDAETKETKKFFFLSWNHRGS